MSRVLAVAFLLAGACLPGFVVRSVRAAAPALAAPRFPGPRYGVITPAPLTPQDFAFQCDTGVTTAPMRAAGVTVLPGAGIRSQGCGYATIVLNHPASGHFRASFAVPDGAPPGSQAGLGLLVLSSDGYRIHSSFPHASTGKPAVADVDVAGGVSLSIAFLTPSPVVVYGVRLTGLARVVRPAPLQGSGMPTGATPVPARDVTPSCNAGTTSSPSTVSGVTIPQTGTYFLGGCGTLTLHLSPGSARTLAVRFGTDSIQTAYTSIPAQMSLRVLDGAGHLVRKAIALTSIGSGLQALWVDTTGGSTVTLTDDLGTHVVATAISWLAAAYAPHANPDHAEFGSPSGGAVDVSPEALVTIANASIGTGATTVGHQPLAPDSYIVMGTGGIAELIMTNAHGRFRARFGILDTASSAHQQHAVTLTVLDQSSHPLVQVRATATYGAAGTLVSADLDGGSLLQIQENGGAEAALYNLSLSGHATLYDRIFPPSEPPISTPGGTAVSPYAFTLAGNVHVADQDTLLIHQAALEQWSLEGGGGGTATLPLASLHGAQHVFSMLYGLAAIDQLYLAHVHLTVLNAGGKAVRTVKGVTRPAYGPQRLAIDLRGGTTLQIGWEDAPLTVFALTAA